MASKPQRLAHGTELFSLNLSSPGPQHKGLIHSHYCCWLRAVDVSVFPGLPVFVAVVVAAWHNAMHMLIDPASCLVSHVPPGGPP